MTKVEAPVENDKEIGAEVETEIHKVIVLKILELWLTKKEHMQSKLETCVEITSITQGAVVIVAFKVPMKEGSKLSK